MRDALLVWLGLCRVNCEEEGESASCINQRRVSVWYILCKACHVQVDCMSFEGVMRHPEQRTNHI